MRDELAESGAGLRPPPFIPHPARWVVLTVVAAGNFVVSLDTTVNVALPAMTEALDAPIASLQWIIIAYVLTNTGLVLGFGRLADLIGRRRVWVVGLFALAAALVSCGLAESLWQLVPARALQAVGAAMIAASGGALVTASFPVAQRGRALGIAAMGAAAGSATGPLLGGVLVDVFGWQGVFLGRAPIALAAGVLSVLLLPRVHEERTGGRFDAVGMGLLAVALVCLLLALNRGPAWGWADARVSALGAVAVALLVGFTVQERRCAAPIIDLHLLRDGWLAAANLSAYLSSLAMFGVWLLLPYYLVDGRGYRPVEAGWLLASVPAATALVAPLAGWVADRAGAFWPMLTGLLCEAVALLLIASVGVDASPVRVVAFLLLLGMGLGVFTAPNQSVVMGRVPPSAFGAGAGMLSMTRTLGSVSGVAVLGAVYAAGLPETPAGQRPAFSRDAFGAAFTVAAGVAVCAALVSIVPKVWGRR